jgi:hypothetical protein
MLHRSAGGGIHVDIENKLMQAGEKTLKEGDWITLKRHQGQCLRSENCR